MDTKQISIRTEARQKLRREQLAKARAEKFNTSVAMAEALEFSQSYLSQLLCGHSSIGDEVADKIEDRLGLPDGYLDASDAPARHDMALTEQKLTRIWQRHAADGAWWECWQHLNEIGQVLRSAGCADGYWLFYEAGNVALMRAMSEIQVKQRSAA
jgi:transcriptional regulator with XRE-family HTH domain